MATRALPPAPTADAGRPYDGDTYGWSLDQAAHLRAGRFDLLDIENLVDEVEAVARSEYDKLESALRVLLMHMLKWRYQPARRGNSWRASIIVQRRHALRSLRRNPSLKPRLEEALLEAYGDARAEAAAEMGVEEATFPETSPFTRDEIFEPGFEDAD